MTKSRDLKMCHMFSRLVSLLWHQMWTIEAKTRNSSFYAANNLGKKCKRYSYLVRFWCSIGLFFARFDGYSAHDFLHSRLASNKMNQIWSPDTFVFFSVCVEAIHFPSFAFSFWGPHLLFFIFWRLEICCPRFTAHSKFSARKKGEETTNDPTKL